MLELSGLAAQLRDLGVRRVHTYAWRDLDDPHAGGSEVHADEILRRWSEVGLEIVHRTSSFSQPRRFERNGYAVVQHGGRAGVVLRTPWEGWRRDRHSADAVIDIWNGLPWLSPIWFEGPRVTWLHHVHGPLWRESFPAPIALVGRVVEARVMPVLYRRSPVVTLSPSGRQELLHLGFPPDLVHVVEPGISGAFRPDPTRRAATPLVVVVGRLALMKRHLDVVRAVAIARRTVPELHLELIGDGPDRAAVEAGVREHAAEEWCTLRGRVSEAELVDAYRRAWIFASASRSEGWGMVLTEAAACGTPAVASRITGHRDAVDEGRSGVLFDDVEECAAAIVRLVTRPDELARLQEGARAHAANFDWDRAAARHLEILLTETSRRRPR